MKTTLTIFLKEFKETLRDRRTLLTMIVMPFAILPLLFFALSTIQKSQKDKILEKELRIAVIDHQNGAELIKQISRRADFKIKTGLEENEFRDLIREDSLDFGLVIAENFDEAVSKGETGNIDFYFDSTQDELLSEGLREVIANYNDKILAVRLDSAGINQSTLKPTEVVENDVYTKSESLGKLIGGSLPYVFVLFCLMGAMYPAIDLFTGEKERGTMETLLAAPVSRWSILLGKMGVVVVGGVISGLLTIVGLFVGLKINPEVPEMISNVVKTVLEPMPLLMVLTMLIPLTIFFAGVLIPAALSSKDFKEAQSRIQPMMLLVILPLLVATLPGIKLDFTTALIPVLNVALASREIIAKTIEPSLLIIVYLSLIVLAGISIAVCVRWFNDERKVLF